MVIVSPYARPGYTDRRATSLVSILAFVEHTFGLPPLSGSDGSAYDYRDAFDYGQAPLQGVAMVRENVPSWEVRFIHDHPPDPNDPT